MKPCGVHYLQEAQEPPRSPGQDRIRAGLRLPSAAPPGFVIVVDSSVLIAFLLRHQNPAVEYLEIVRERMEGLQTRVGDQVSSPFHGQRKRLLRALENVERRQNLKTVDPGRLMFRRNN